MRRPIGTLAGHRNRLRRIDYFHSIAVSIGVLSHVIWFQISVRPPSLFSNGFEETGLDG